MNKRLFAERALSISISLFVFGWAMAAIHEGLHYLAADALGYSGVIDLTWGGAGTFTFGDPAPGGFALVLVLAAGGLGTAALYGALWWGAAIGVRYTTWELDDASALAFLTVQQLLYVPLDVLGLWQNTALWVGTFLASGVLTASIYGRRLVKWLAGET